MPLKDHSRGVRGFYLLSASYYGARLLADRRDDGMKVHDEMNFGIFYPDDGGGTSGEFTMQWVELSGKAVPRLQVFDDAWSALLLFRDLLEALALASDTIETDQWGARKAALRPQQVVEIAASLGLKDLTKRDDPYAARAPARPASVPGDWRRA